MKENNKKKFWLKSELLIRPKKIGKKVDNYTLPTGLDLISSIIRDECLQMMNKFIKEYNLDENDIENLYQEFDKPYYFVPDISK